MEITQFVTLLRIYELSLSLFKRHILFHLKNIILTLVDRTLR